MAGVSAKVFFSSAWTAFESGKMSLDFKLCVN